MTSVSLLMDVQLLEIPMAMCGEDMLKFILFCLADICPLALLSSLHLCDSPHYEITRKYIFNQRFSPTAYKMQKVPEATRWYIQSSQTS